MEGVRPYELIMGQQRKAKLVLSIAAEKVQPALKKHHIRQRAEQN